ncbi:MAG TPA: exopolysaccharide biosynthesis polyprenyl glycosylphosphotransferase, partial [Petrotogaceae bacterium]|nr:exopolysaccharide biosynthesis polyprenyl glycosylphosphotransferase [Petrotogaceae bacterium]
IQNTIRVFMGVVSGFAMLAVFYYFLRDYVSAESVFYTFVFATVIIPVVNRISFALYIKTVIPRKYLVIGKKNEIGHILDEITRKSYGKLLFVEYINPSPAKLHKLIEENYKKRDFSPFTQFFYPDEKPWKEGTFDSIIITDPILEKFIQNDLEKLKDKGMDIEYLPTVAEFYLKRIPVEVLEKFEEHYKIAFGSISNSPAKRMLDFIVSLVALIILSPILAVVALSILIENGRPVVFKQPRTGKDNEVFIMHKFRSMRNQSEEDVKGKFATDEKSRILKIGRIIRMFRLDETLQFWDILTGEMSLIGPRPEQPHFVSQYEKIIPFYSYRHKLKTGLTGWAQIMYKYTSTVEETKVKLSYDLYYVKNRTSILDINIILKTIEAVIWRRGAV